YHIAHQDQTVLTRPSRAGGVTNRREGHPRGTPRLGASKAPSTYSHPLHPRGGRGRALTPPGAHLSRRLTVPPGSRGSREPTTRRRLCQKTQCNVSHKAR